MRLTGKDILTGTVVEIIEGATMTEVKVDLGGDETITMMLPGEALNELDARVGEELKFHLQAGATSGGSLH